MGTCFCADAPVEKPLVSCKWSLKSSHGGNFPGIHWGEQLFTHSAYRTWLVYLFLGHDIFGKIQWLCQPVGKCTLSPVLHGGENESCNFRDFPLFTTPQPKSKYHHVAPKNEHILYWGRVSTVNARGEGCQKRFEDVWDDNAESLHRVWVWFVWEALKSYNSW